MVPTERRHKPYSECHNQFIGNQERLIHEMADSVMRLDAVRLFAVKLRQVYANKPATIDELRTNIEREIAAVSADLCLTNVKNWVQRLNCRKRARGGHAK